MARVEMTLYEALTKRKIYEDRLKKFNLADKPLFGYYTEAKPTIRGESLDDVARVAQSHFDTFIHLQDNLRNLQAAINEANISNTIVIKGFNNNEPVTLVRAIVEEQKLPTRINYLNVIQRKLDEVQTYIETNNKQLSDPKYVYEQVSKLGMTDKKSEETSEQFAKMIEDYQKKFTLKFFDPNKIVERNWIQEQLDDIDAFSVNLHSALTEANTRIKITVDLND